MTEPEQTTPVPMDQYVDLVKRWREATKARMGWTKIEEEIKAEIDKILGDRNEATINGETAVERRWEERFATARFKKEDPDTARFFEHEVTKREIDVDMIRRTRPDLYKQYQTSKLINKFDG
jgi:hypothetical protein